MDSPHPGGMPSARQSYASASAEPATPPPNHHAGSPYASEAPGTGGSQQLVAVTTPPAAAAAGAGEGGSPDHFRPLARGLHHSHQKQQRTASTPPLAPQHSDLQQQPSGFCSPSVVPAAALQPPGALPLPLAMLGAGGGLAGGAALAGLAGRGGEMRSMQAVAGVTRLMQQCSSMLRERMYMGGGAAAAAPGAARSPAPFDPQEVLFPVVDSVLGQITQEYEKRLLAKDHDLSGARDRAAAAQRQAAEMQVGGRDLGGVSGGPHYTAAAG
jgi:hypothetical protein